MARVATMTVNTLYMKRKHTNIMQIKVQREVEIVPGRIVSS